MILVDFIPRHKLGKAETTHAVNHTLPALIQKTGETVNFVDFLIIAEPVNRRLF